MYDNPKDKKEQRFMAVWVNELKRRVDLHFGFVPCVSLAARPTGPVQLFHWMEGVVSRLSVSQIRS